MPTLHPRSRVRRTLAHRRLLTIAMMVVYFGFILLVAFNKPLPGTLVTEV